MRANQLRLWLASLAYVLMSALRRISLSNTRLIDATCGTIRPETAKIGALVRISRPARPVLDGLGFSLRR